MTHDRWLAVILVCLAAFLAAAPSSAETIADFVNGTDSLPDGYLGIAGNGWAGPWVEGKSTSGAPTVITSVPTTNPLNVTQPQYLNVQVTGTTSGAKFASTGRDYKGTGGVDVTLPHAIDFKYRVNETLASSTTFTSIDDRYQLFDSTVTSVGATASWFIGCYGGAGSYIDSTMVGRWVVYDGGGHDTPVDTGMLLSRQVNTGITVTTGTIYDFHVEVDPATYTYDVTISSGGTELYDSTDLYENGLGWRTSAGAVAGVVRFLGNVTTTADTRDFSVDSIRIVPEPATLLMVISAIMVLGGVRRRRG
jgi:hypothetical protein